MKKKLIIIGAGGHGKVIADIAMKMNAWESIAFLDDNIIGTELLGIKVIGKISDVLKHSSEADIFVAIGDNRAREKMQQKMEVDGATIPVLIHPNAVIGNEVKIGAGTVVMAGVVINCSTTIGKGCIINTGATVDHDNLIENYVHISPGVNLAGTVSVGKGTWLGIGCAVINNVRIAEGCIVGGGTVVIKDVPYHCTVVGNPARVVKHARKTE